MGVKASPRSAQLRLARCRASEIEVAMRLGVNYPKGLLQWADEWGHDVCVQRMDALYARYREDRYRGAVLLRDTLQGKFFN